MKFATLILIKMSLEYSIDCRISLRFTETLGSRNISDLAMQQNSRKEPLFLNYSIITPDIFRDICRTTFLVNIFTTMSISVVGMTNKIPNLEIYLTGLGSIEWHYFTDNYVTSKSVVIILDEPDQFEELINKPSTLWSQESRFVILVVICHDNIEIETTYLWQKHRIYKYVLICGLINSTLYIFRPFVPEERRKTNKVKVLEEIEENVKNGNKNLYGELLNIAMFPTIPTVIIQNGLLVGGVDFRTFEILTKFMNFSSIIVKPSDGLSFTQAGRKAVGSIRDVVLGNVDIALNAHFLKDYKIDKITMTQFAYVDKVCFVVAMPGFKSPFNILIHIFTPEVWGLLITVYFLAIIIYFAIQKAIQPIGCPYKCNDLFMHMYELNLLGATSLKTSAISQKLLVGNILISVLIFSNTFQSLLMTGISRPARDSFINTIEEVFTSNLFLQSQRAESLINDPQLLPKINALRKKKLKGNNFLRLGRFPLMKVNSYRNYVHYDHKNNLTEHLHTIPECVSSSFLGYVLPKSTPLKGRINELLARIQEHGLVVKWYGGEMDLILRQLYWPVETNEDAEESKPFTVKDLAFNFKLLVCGLVMSVLVFIIELVLGWKRGGRRNNN